jgi:hypothetical protein
VTNPGELSQLRALRKSRLDAMVARSVSSGVEPSSDELKALDNLTKLCDLVEASTRRPPPRWRLGVLLGLILGVVTLLFFTEVRSVLLSGSVLTGTATFRLAGSAEVSKGWTTGLSAGISEADTIRVPDLGNVAEREVAGVALSLECASGSKPGCLTIAPLSLPDRGTVTVQTLSPGRYRIQLKSNQADGPVLSARITAEGSIRIGGLDEPEGVLTLPRPRSFVATARQSLTLDLAVPPEEEIAFSRLLPVDGLAFVDVEESGEHSAQIRELSMIRSGSLIFETLAGREHKLREAETMRFEGLHGSVRSVKLGPAGVTVSFEGTAREVKSHSRSLKPTLLEYWRAQKPVELLWGSALSLFGAVLAALRWLKVEV